MSELRVEAWRGDHVESVHLVDVAAVDATGREVMRAGETELPVFARSALKPFQALPLVEDGVVDRYGMTEEELALCCASHSGEPRHVEVAASILARIGLDEDALACGPHDPFDDAATRALREAGAEPRRLHNNCSGKHAGMLALARAHGWPTEGYHRLEHPVQQRMLDEIARWTDVDREDVWTAVDGCGVTTFGVPLPAMAGAFARLVAASAGRGEQAASEGSADRATAAGRVMGAMTSHPFLVGGTGRLCTRLMEVTEGRVLAKVGAEGVYGAAARDAGIGIALKARDGARRAAEVALVAVLATLELLRAEELEALAAWARPTLRNTRGEQVGVVQPAPALEVSRG